MRGELAAVRAECTVLTEQMNVILRSASDPGVVTCTSNVSGGGGCSTVAHGSDDVTFAACTAFVISNEVLNASTSGCGVRQAPRLDADLVSGVPWGSEITGSITEDGWLRLVDGCGFIPEYGHGRRIMSLSSVGVLPARLTLFEMD